MKMPYPMVESSFAPETGHVVNTDEEFFVNVKLHNPLPNFPPFNLITLENCRISVTNTVNSSIHPSTNRGLPKTVLGHVALSAETTANNDWEQEFTLIADHVSGVDATVTYEAIVDIYFGGNLIPGYDNYVIPGVVSQSPQVVPIMAG